MTEALRITTLGGLEIVRGRAPVQGFALRKSEALLVYLAVTGRSHSREALAGLLWGEATEAHARAYLRRVLAELRRHVGPYLTITRREVAINSACPHWLDAAAFERGVYEATGVTQIPLAEPSVAALTDAIELYRGNFLQGFHVRQALAFEEWSLLERERLALSALRALHALTDHYTALGDYPRAITYAERLLALEPCQEEAHRSMMTLLALSGQQGAALRQYDVCRRLLAEELGVEPDASTRALYERIKTGDVIRLRRRAFAPTQAFGAPLTPFVGRTAELAGIKTCLEHPACRLLTLAGPGGSGKTRLALEALKGYAAQIGHPVFEHGVFFIALASVDAAQALVPAAAQGLGLALRSGTDPKAQLLGYLRDKRVLLVLDNFEHLLSDARPVDAVDLITEILAAAPHVKIMVTSRARLKTGYEHLLQIGGLDYPVESALEVLSQGQANGWAEIADYSGVQLFASSAQRLRPNLQLTPANLRSVARICDLVDGMPLAILLAASWARILTPSEIADRLSEHVSGPDIHGLDFLQTDWQDVPQRQRSMRAVFDHSWRLLTDGEREVFAALSVFRGGFTGHAAWQVGGASLQDLMALVDKSMLYRGLSGRYEMHELLRHYAAEKLKSFDDGRYGAVRDRHCASFLAALENWGPVLIGPQQAKALADIDAEAENARAAWEWAVENGYAGRLYQALDPLCYFYKWRGRFHEGAHTCQTVLDGLTAASDDGASFDERRVLARAMVWQGVFHWRLGNVGRGSQLLLESQSMMEDPALAAHDIRSEKAFLLWRMGRTMFDVERGQSRRLYEDSLALYRALDDRWGAANVLEDLGWVARYFGDFQTARRLGEESLALRRALDDQRGVYRSLRALCSVAYRQGRLEEAERLMRESSAIPLEMGNRADIAEKLSSSGWVLAILGQFAEGHDRLVESQTTWHGLGLPNMVAWVNIPLGFATLHRGSYAEARAQIEQGLSVARALADRGRTGFALFALGWVAVGQGAYAEAQQLLEESGKLYQGVGEWAEVGETLAILGYAYIGLGQYIQAQRHLCGALRMALELRAFLPALFALPGVAMLLADGGKLERAVEVYTLASRYPFVANSRWFADVVGRHISALAACPERVPPDVVAAAQQRGTAWDVWDAAEELTEELGESQVRAEEWGWPTHARVVIGGT